MSDEVDDESPSPLQSLQAPPSSPAGREWGESYLKAHPEGVDTKGEAALLQDFEANAEEARQSLRAAREHLAAQRMDPSVLGMRVAQAMLAPSRFGGGISNQLSNAAGAVADWRQQNQQFQGQQAEQDQGFAQQLAGVDRQSLQARLQLQQLKERNQTAMLDAAVKATAQPEKSATPPVRPHYELSEHDVTLPDGTPGKQMFVLESSTGKLVPYGTASPTIKGAGLDSRSNLMFQRVLSSANEAAASIKNVTELPTTVSTGWLGTGHGPGPSILGSTKNVLVNKLAPQDVQDYMTILPGLGRNLATIETAGLAPQGALTGSFDALQMKEGDTGYTKLHKLAEYRQILEKGIETNLSNPKIPTEQKEAVQQIIDGVRTAIPFTHHDVTALEKAHAEHPNMTMADYLKQQGLGTKTPRLPAMTNEKGWALHQDAQGNMAYVSPDGKQYEEVK